MNRTLAVFYDLDNTLYKQAEDVEQRIDYCLKRFSLPDAGEIRLFWLHQWMDNGPVQPDLIGRVVDKFSLNIPKDELVSAYRACHTKISLEQRTASFLLDMKQQGTKQFVITNGHPETQRNKIASLGISSLFDEVVIACGEYSKPSSHWYNEFIERHRLVPEECISIGDWFAIDGIASRRAGVRFFYLKGGPVKEDVPEDVVIIEDITEIGDYV